MAPIFRNSVRGNAVTEMESDRRVMDRQKMHYYVLCLRIRVKASEITFDPSPSDSVAREKDTK